MQLPDGCGVLFFDESLIDEGFSPLEVVVDDGDCEEEKEALDREESRFRPRFRSRSSLL